MTDGDSHGTRRVVVSRHNDAVSSERMAAVDAQLCWLSAKVPNDQFLVYVFEGEPDVASGIDEVRRNAEACDELRLRVCDDNRWRYPRWVPGDVGSEQFVIRDAVGDWRSCLTSIGRLDPLDATRMAWCVHVFPPATVVVQVSHSLGDGNRSAALAGSLFGRRKPIPGVIPDRGSFPRRAFDAARAYRAMARDMESGLLERAPAPRPALSVNNRSAATPLLRTLVLDRLRLRPTVTVAALCAIAEALGGYLCDRGENASLLAAEVPMAGLPTTKARNNFRNVSIGLYPELAPGERAARIAGELYAQRRRGEHAAAVASAAAFAAVPAPLLRWGVGRFDPHVRSATVSGHTVVSSVNRGPADLTFGGHPVTLTAGFPALSPMQSLTHGVHGIGDVVALSVHADPGVVDVDDYLARLSRSLGVCRGR